MAKFIEQIEKLLLILIMLATLVAVGDEIMHMFHQRKVELSDLLLLFIYAEVIGMLAAYYNSSRIPVTLPLIIAMTALSRMIILQSKELDKIVLLYESSSILLLSIAAVIMSLKDKISLEKLKNRHLNPPG
ncbi:MULTISPECIES: phosphate-starvation-inducible PsiE family protein [unclassified Alteromonas]|uniref:phosphate-starvation-inducible PsiE family protein n=1 Tax=unclassified Alteromonas TaxID=2614992 RepID=UPI000C36BF2D|nr:MULTISPECIES: phosphate-starvation-inducible PsiE family protein [unclassified Alteromonas]AYA66248.1 phosphate-starvation-inducible E-like protein [Alteromonas sp. RKMC-009]MBT79721.1 phosphate-starvation-inducible E-like protein [Alteromonadaceae bacterium]MDO6474228.1 phosphate-starvation-inducible PsiE family protein [Alteromonas sp. 1_MG-2023]MEC7689433.1 phosphate-starvation-inducible PsiE family protein [Pseudomonadota bacterium]